MDLDLIMFMARNEGGNKTVNTNDQHLYSRQLPCPRQARRIQMMSITKQNCAAIKVKNATVTITKICYYTLRRAIIL